jgi:hypothetical protein
MKHTRSACGCAVFVAQGLGNSVFFRTSKNVSWAQTGSMVGCVLLLGCCRVLSGAKKLFRRRASIGYITRSCFRHDYRHEVDFAHAANEFL